MAIDVASYNRQFLEKIKRGEPIFNNATNQYGVKVRPLTEQSIPLDAEKYWRIIGVHHLKGIENMGNHHVFCDVLNEDGQRVNQSRLVLTQGNASPVFAVVDKPAHEPGTNFPLWKTTRATVAVQWPEGNPLPSESVTGLRIDHPDEEVGNTWGHHSFYLVFQRANIAEATEPQPDSTDEQPAPDDSPPLSLEETITLVGQPLIIPLNPTAMFYKIAQERNLGERLTSEYDAEYQGKTYRAQIYEKGIVYAAAGDWGNVKIIPRTN